MKNLSYIILIGALLTGCGNSDAPKKNADSENATYTKAVEQGKMALTNGDIDKALASFGLALDEKPEDSQATKYVAQLKGTKEIEHLIDEKEYKKAIAQANGLLDATDLLNSVNREIENLRAEAKSKQDKALAAKTKKSNRTNINKFSNSTTSSNQSKYVPNLFE